MWHDDDTFVREVLWRQVPESREYILDIENKERMLFGETVPRPGMYSLVSVAFVHPILTPMLEAQIVDSACAARCSMLIEDLLGSGRIAVAEMVSIRITDHLLGFSQYWSRFRPYSGRLLLHEVEDRKEFYKDIS